MLSDWANLSTALSQCLTLFPLVQCQRRMRRNNVQTFHPRAGDSPWFTCAHTAYSGDVHNHKRRLSDHDSTFASSTIFHTLECFTIPNSPRNHDTTDLRLTILDKQGKPNDENCQVLRTCAQLNVAPINPTKISAILLVRTKTALVPTAEGNKTRNKMKLPRKKPCLRKLTQKHDLRNSTYEGNTKSLFHHVQRSNCS